MWYMPCVELVSIAVCSHLYNGVHTHLFTRFLMDTPLGTRALVQIALKSVRVSYPFCKRF